MRLPLLLVLLLAAPACGADDRKDVLVADFEGATYGDGWTATGTAFGTGPAKGALPGQMAVSGFLGKGLVNSFLGGDDSTGTLTSPEITVERKYLNFLIGGGKHPGRTCVNLLVGGKVVRTASGPNDQPGGSEHLDWHTWDVAEFEGRRRSFRSWTSRRAGGAHQRRSHRAERRQEAGRADDRDARRRTTVPAAAGEERRAQAAVKFVVDGQTVREFDIELALDGKPDFHATADVSAFKGKKLTVEATLPADAKLAALVVPSDKWADADKLYQEKHRPLFHFTSRTGWLNDPNGLVYHDGTWHLFYQHNPFGREWGNMHWGHATSTDLFRWKERASPSTRSGTTTGRSPAPRSWTRTTPRALGTKEKPPLVLAYTSTGRGECIAHSADGGKTWTEYEKNPVVKHAGRDPKLIWHERAKHWVMAVYDEHDKKQWIAFYTSPT
jgi:fructan beta-fructosidase